jgi:hypothetical protein
VVKAAKALRKRLEKHLRTWHVSPSATYGVSIHLDLRIKRMIMT